MIAVGVNGLPAFVTASSRVEGDIFHEASEALAVALPSVTVLDCEHVNLSDDVILFGAPLWTDMDRGNPLSSLAIRSTYTRTRARLK